ncbi:MAG: mechanosensitive ion channel domain-containing protein [Gammaproteobacteria bacterium]
MYRLVHYLSKSIIVLVFFVAVCPPSLAQPREKIPSPEQAAAPADNETLKLSEIKGRKKSLEAKTAGLSRRLAAAKTRNQPEEAEILQTMIETVGRIDTIYAQQSGALEKIQANDAKNAQFLEAIANLEMPATEGKRFSFMELDRVREELDVESRREKTLLSEIKLAEGALDDAKKSLQMQQDALVQLEADAGDKPHAPASKLAIESARWNLELARETGQLRELELHGQKQSRAVHQTQLEWLRKQVGFLEAHAAFEPEELREQLRRLEKEEFELNRDLSQAKDQQITVKGRLEQVRKKLAAAEPEFEKRLESETETLRLEFEKLKTVIDSATRRIGLLADSKSIWQRRFAVFNGTAEQSDMPKWRSDASQSLAQIDQNEATIGLWLGDWKNRLITLNNKLDSKPDAAAGVLHGLSAQREYMLAIIDRLQDMQTALENSRRLHTKLIDEINHRTSQRSWRDWIDLALHYETHGNAMLDWTYAVTAAAVTFAILFLLRWILIDKLRHLEDPNKASLADGFLTSIKRANILFFLMISVSVASLFLSLDSGAVASISRLTKVAVIFQVAVWSSSFLRIWIFNILARKTKRDGASLGALTIFNFSSQVILWSIALLLILQNLGIDVTALVAGLGIGGVAVALSLQRILNDLFSSLSIVLDKPFVVGDFVIFDDFLGSVEHIGIKTTRIRSLTGEQIICPNGDLLNTRIRNFKRMHERRVVFTISVVYQTSAETLARVPAMIRAIIEAQDNTRFDRAHFSSYGDSALIFEIVYYVLSSDYNLYMDIQQAINLEIYNRFAESGIEFAYPTQSLYLQTRAGPGPGPGAVREAVRSGQRE